jgi:hypothetical protein
MRVCSIVPISVNKVPCSGYFYIDEHDIFTMHQFTEFTTDFINHDNFVIVCKNKVNNEYYMNIYIGSSNITDEAIEEVKYHFSRRFVNETNIRIIYLREN